MYLHCISSFIIKTHTMASAPARFPLFPYLPIELRLQIWRHSCQGRVVSVRYEEETDRCVTTTKPPAVLQTCRESRAEGLLVYRQAFSTKSHPHSAIYFSPRLDVLYLPRHGSMGYSNTARNFGQYVFDSTDHVYSLAVDHVNPVVRKQWETYNKYCLIKNFPNLREIFLVLGIDGGGDELKKNTIASACPPGGEQVEFVDPKGDAEAICKKLMEGVHESFEYEVHPGDQVSLVPKLLRAPQIWQSQQASSITCM